VLAGFVPLPLDVETAPPGPSIVSMMLVRIVVNCPLLEPPGAAGDPEGAGAAGGADGCAPAAGELGGGPAPGAGCC